jgi:hypothetical protein
VADGTGIQWQTHPLKPMDECDGHVMLWERVCGISGEDAKSPMPQIVKAIQSVNNTLFSSSNISFSNIIWGYGRIVAKPDMREMQQPQMIEKFLVGDACEDHTVTGDRASETESVG